jgi:hypothetical protein
VSRPALTIKHRELCYWYADEFARTGISVFGEIRERLPKYYEAMENHARALIAAVDGDNLPAADQAIAKIKKLYGRAVDRISEMKRRAA